MITTTRLAIVALLALGATTTACGSDPSRMGGDDGGGSSPLPAARDLALRCVQAPGEAANDRWLHKLLRRTSTEPGIAAREACDQCRPLMYPGGRVPLPA